MLQRDKKKILFGVMAGLGTRIIGIFTGLVTMPLFFKYLPKDVLAVWMLFVGTEILVNLTDLGFSPVLQRHIGFELGKGDKKGIINHEGASYFLNIAKFTCRHTSCLLFMSLCFFGYLFLRNLDLSHALLHEALVGLVIFSFGKGLLARFKYFETGLNGHGEVGWQNWIFSFSVLLALAGFYCVLRFMNGSLVALTVVSAMQSLVIVLGNFAVFRIRIAEPFRVRRGVTWSDARPYLRPAMDMFIVTLGAFMILNTDQYFIAKILGPGSLPDYAATYRLLMVVYTTATTLSMMTVPFVSRLSASEDNQNVKKLLIINSSIGMLVFLSGVLSFAFFGDQIIELWLGPGHFVGWPIMWVFCVMLTLENHHVIFAQVGLNCKTDPTWGKVSVLSGLLNLMLTYIGAKTMGLVGVASATMISQMLTNNWYAVRKTLLLVGMEFHEYLRRSAAVWGTFLVTTAALLSMLRILELGLLMSVALSMLVITVSFCAWLGYFFRLLRVS